MNQTEQFSIIIKTHAQLEAVLATELQEMGINNPQILKRAVSFEGDIASLYKVNYMCRTAIRVLKQIHSFTFEDNDSYYKNIKSIAWENYLKPQGTFAVDAIAKESVFNNTQFVQRFTKDAIVDRFREKFSTRPNVEFVDPDILVNIHIYKNQCVVSLDSSGESLHKRGYRKANVEAPINEVTAAGIIKLTGWDGDADFLDPMCGSGTILIEAAMAAMKIPAAYYRNSFGFQKWNDYNESLFNKIKEEADANIIECNAHFFGADIDKKNLRITRENILNAKLHHDIELSHCAFENSNPPFEKGIIVTNPPYGERLEVENATEFYKTIGNTLKHKYPHYTAWIIAQDNEALKQIGLRPSKRISLYNGKLECKLLRFDMYQGKKYQDLQ